MVQLVRESEQIIRAQAQKEAHSEDEGGGGGGSGGGSGGGGGGSGGGGGGGRDTSKAWFRQERDFAEAMVVKEQQFAEAMELRERKYEEMLHLEHAAHQQVIERLLRHQEEAYKEKVEKEEGGGQEQGHGREGDRQGGDGGDGEKKRQEKEQWLEAALTKGLEHAQKQQRLQQWGEDEGGWRLKQQTLGALHNAWASSSTNARRQKQLVMRLHKLLGDQTLFLRWLLPYLALDASGGAPVVNTAAISEEGNPGQNGSNRHTEAQKTQQQQIAMAKGMCSRLERGARAALLGVGSIDDYTQQVDSAKAAVEAAGAAVGAALSATTSAAVVTEAMAVAILWRQPQPEQLEVETGEVTLPKVDSGRQSGGLLTCLPES
jgi:hypothetical protein